MPEIITENLTIILSPTEQERIIKKIQHKREQNRIRQLRYYENHADKINGKLKAKRLESKPHLTITEIPKEQITFEMLNNNMTSLIPAKQKQRGRCVKPISEADIIKSIIRSGK